MKTKSSLEIAVVGAGIAGLTSAYMLRKLGYTVSVFEASDHVRGLGAGLGLASNAIKAFEYLGLDEEVIAISNPLPSFKICDRLGTPLFSIDTHRIKEKFKVDNYAVHRAELHRLLIDKLDSIPLFTAKKLHGLTPTSSNVLLRFEDGTEERFDFVIGADGVNSRVRQSLMPQAEPRYAGYWCWRNVVHTTDLTTEGAFACWGDQGRFGITPLSNNRLYWFACLNSSGHDEVADFKLEDLRDRFDSYAPIIPQLLALSKEENMITGPIVDIDPLEHFYRDRVLLLGDAAHATTPNMGQGACMAIEDVVVLQDELRQNDFINACHNFEKRRRSRTRYMIKNSRRVGTIAQIDNRLLSRGRDILFRNLPDAWVQRPIKRLLNEDFMTVVNER